MRRYETIFIAHPDLSPEQRPTLFDKIKGIVSDGEGMLVKFDEWGYKRLAYAVKKMGRGYYVFMEYCGGGPLVRELERNFRLDERILKYMTVLKDEEVDMAAVAAEIAAAEEAKAKAETPAEPAAVETKAGEEQEQAAGDESETGGLAAEETEASESSDTSSDKEESDDATL